MHRSPARTLIPAVAGLLTVLALLAPTGTASAGTHPASKPAAVKITLKADLSGRLVSDRAACVRQRLVYVLGHTPSGQLTGYAEHVSGDDGRFGAADPRAGSADAFGLVVGRSACEVAQSRSVAAPDVRTQLAPRKISLQVTANAVKGRVSSPAKGCTKKAEVVFFSSFDGDEFSPAVVTKTDRHGRYRYALQGKRGGSVRLLAIVLGDDACSVAQSPTRTPVVSR